MRSRLIAPRGLRAGDTFGLVTEAAFVRDHLAVLDKEFDLPEPPPPADVLELVSGATPKLRPLAETFDGLAQPEEAFRAAKI
jgi:hypothetical protein